MRLDARALLRGKYLRLLQIFIGVNVRSRTLNIGMISARTRRFPLRARRLARFFLPRRRRNILRPILSHRVHATQRATQQTQRQHARNMRAQNVPHGAPELWVGQAHLLS